jgi:hypothetical protein
MFKGSLAGRGEHLELSRQKNIEALTGIKSRLYVKIAG